MNPLFNQLSNLDTLLSALMGGTGVQIQPIAGDVPVVQVSIEGRQELPIFVTCSDAQTICLCYLWTDAAKDRDNYKRYYEYYQQQMK